MSATRAGLCCPQNSGLIRRRHLVTLEGTDQEHVEMIIPESLFLFPSLLWGFKGEPVRDCDAKRAIKIKHTTKMTPKHI